MKKSLFLMAAAALALTACTSEDDVVQSSAPQKAEVQAVGFDVYTPAATNMTRAGLQGTMTTGRLQRIEADGGGFGVYAFLTEDEKDDDDVTAYTSASPLTGEGAKTNVPNFMVNEKLLWNNTNLGWYYNPLKYWPNETNKDSQNTNATMEDPTAKKHLDRLTFFAYAPYVTETAANGTGTGIIRITDKAGLLNTANTADPTIAWVANTSDDDVNPDEGVDLLWGVAPAGGLSYTAVNRTTVTVDEGKPLIDMIKPDVNTSMKFLFNHALARFGFTVVAAVDQVSPGGTLDPNTKITINKLKITGPFGSTGELNLNNGTHANVANWTKIKTTPIDNEATGTGDAEVLILQGNYKADGSGDYVADEASADDRAKNAIAPHLRWTKTHATPAIQPVVGVTTAKQDLLRPSTKWFNKLSSAPTYNPAKIYYTESAGVYTEAHATKTITGDEGYFAIDGSGNYIKQGAGTINSPAYPEALATDYYTIVTTKTTAGTEPAGDDDTKLYTLSGSDYNFAGTKSTISAALTAASKTWSTNDVDYYTIVETNVPLAGIAFTYPAGTYYEAERNYVYVVPTNNVWTQNSGLGDNPASLRTIEVQIEYYITTEDSKLSAKRAQTKNVVTKTVVLPSLANGKTYNLNMVLGLTSVKIEAEVDDWKVVNSQVDLPQNTAE